MTFARSRYISHDVYEQAHVDSAIRLTIFDVTLEDLRYRHHHKVAFSTILELRHAFHRLVPIKQCHRAQTLSGHHAVSPERQSSVRHCGDRFPSGTPQSANLGLLLAAPLPAASRPFRSPQIGTDTEWQTTVRRAGPDFRPVSDSLKFFRIRRVMMPGAGISRVANADAYDPSFRHGNIFEESLSAMEERTPVANTLCRASTTPNGRVD